MVAFSDEFERAKQRAVILFEAGKNGGEAAKELGISEATGRRWHRKWRDAKLPFTTPPVAPETMKDMELAALRQQVKSQPQLTVTGYDEEPTASKDMWDRYVASNAKRIEKALASTKFQVKTDTNEPIAVAFVSDQHISGDNCIDLKRMQEDAEFIANTPRVFAVLGGDGVDLHIKHRAAIIAARTTPDDQLKLFDYYLQIFAEKIAVMVSGNHDHWAKQMAGVDVVQMLSDKNKIRFSRHSAYIEWLVGRVTYRICVAHQFRFNSQLNQTHSPKQMLNFGEHDFDVGVVCHHHEPAQESFRRRGLTRWVARPGAYQVYSDYSAQLGYPTTQPTCPTIVLWPDKRKMIGFDSVQDAAHHMRVT